MIQWFKDNTWLSDWTSLILTVLTVIIIPVGIWLIKKFKLVSRKKYNELLKAHTTLRDENAALKDQIKKYESANDLFSGLEFDDYDGVYVKKLPTGKAEYFCPVCLDSDKKRIHIDKQDDTIGNIYICNKCHKSFGKGIYKLSSADEENSSIFNY